MSQTPNTVQKDKMSVEIAMRESKQAYEREKELRKAQEVQFIDDLKRAILLEGGYVRSLGPEAVEGQVAVTLANPAVEKVKAKRQQSTRLMQMMKAFTKEDEEEEVGGLDDEDDDEWDPVQYAASRDSDDDESSDSFNTSPNVLPPPARGHAKYAHAPPKVAARSGNENGVEDILAPRSRDEERVQLARALRESQQDNTRQSARGSVLSGGSLRHGIPRPAASEGFEEADAQPMPPGRHGGHKDPGAQKPLPPPQRFDEDASDRDRHRHRQYAESRHKAREAQLPVDEYQRHGFKDDLNPARTDRHREGGERDRLDGSHSQRHKQKHPQEKERNPPRSDRPERQWV